MVMMCFTVVQILKNYIYTLYIPIHTVYTVQPIHTMYIVQPVQFRVMI